MSESNWHMSKSVPIGIIGAILVQTFLVGMWANDINSAIAANAKDVARHEMAISALENTVNTQAIQLARIEEGINHIRAATEKLANR